MSSCILSSLRLWRVIGALPSNETVILSPNLVGDWHPIAAVLAGRELDVAEMRVAHLEFSGTQYTIFDRAGAAVDQGHYSLDVSVSPWSIDLHGSAGSGAGKLMQAICALSDDGMGGEILQLSYALDGGHRPSAFNEAETLSQSPQTERLVIALTFQRLSAS